jgi:sulfhydrogenase subunit delta
MADKRRPRLAVWKFASCDGCQLTLLDCEDELLAVASALDIAYFPEASSVMAKGPYDVSLVEGSITTAHDAERIRKIRKDSKFLITIGACVAAVYASPQFIKTLATSTPISSHVKVDFELNGCPIDKRQLIELISAYLAGRKPVIDNHSVCVECKLRGTVCVMVKGTPCLGPVTHAGCGAICPSFNRGCYGCFGAKEKANTAAIAAEWLKLGASQRDVHRVFRTFHAAAEPFREESDAHG